MAKIFLLPLFLSLFFISCGTSTTDKTNADTSAGAKQGLSVTAPQEHKPHGVNDTIFNGPFIDRYDNGVIYMRGDVSGGLRNGEWITFYKSGKEWSRGIYKNGLREGHGVSYYENGQKSSEGEYKKDNMTGKWKFWNAEGKMVEKDFGDK